MRLVGGKEAEKPGLIPALRRGIKVPLSRIDPHAPDCHQGPKQQSAASQSTCHIDNSSLFVCVCVTIYTT